MPQPPTESEPSRTRHVLRRGLLSTSAGQPSTLGFRIWLVPLLVVVFAGSMWYMRAELKSTLQEQMRDKLTTILSANVAALELWYEAHREAATSLAEITEVEAFAATLAELSRRTDGNVDALRQAPELAALREFIMPPLRRHGYERFSLVERAGFILASSSTDAIGTYALPEILGFVADSFTGATTVTRPSASFVPVDATSELQIGTPIVAVAAPLRDEAGDVVTILVVVSSAVELGSILAVARTGASGETYLFDADGVLLSASRFEDQLRTIGLLPDDPAVSSVFNIDIRNPGGDMTAGYVPETARRAQPLTRMAASAVDGHDGVDVEGYADYRGVEVVGAWRWLDRYGVGITTEEDYAETYTGLARLTRTQTGLTILLAVLGLGVSVQSLVIARLGRRASAAAHEIRQLGQYALGQKIGSGGMGEVFRASHAMLRRPTAVKILRLEQNREDQAARFEREVQLTAQLTHPNTVVVYDFGRTADGCLYYAMEYLHGINLQDLVDQTGPLPAGRVIYILQQACGSLAEAHAIGLIHRDIKPANLMLCQRGGVHDFVKVLDFGIVKILGDQATKLTQTGMMSGTPLYMPPEALGGPGGVDARIDVYALGGVAYFMLTGRAIFPDGLGLVEILTAQMNTVPERPSQITAGVPPDLERVIMRCLEKDPDHRPAGSAELLDELSQVSDAGSWDQRAAKTWWSVHPDLAGFSTTGEARTVASPDHPEPPRGAEFT